MLWFVLNYITPAGSRQIGPVAVVEKFNRVSGTALEVFAPTFVGLARRNGVWTRREKPLLFHYVFVRGTLDEIRRLCGLTNGFSFVINRADSLRYLTVPESDLEAFRVIARAYGNQIPCFAVREIDLADGDRVQVVDGEFAGLEGTYIAKRGGRTGSLLIGVTRQYAAVVYDVKADYVRVLEFAQDSKRMYDQIEAFIPRLFAALRQYHAQEKMDASVLAPLVVFCRRFECVDLKNNKLAAKLRLLLLVAYRILGNETEYQKTKIRFDELTGIITNPWTEALSSLLLSILDRDMDRFVRGMELIGAVGTHESKFQTFVRGEYGYYKDRWISE